MMRKIIFLLLIITLYMQAVGQINIEKKVEIERYLGIWKYDKTFYGIYNVREINLFDDYTGAMNINHLQKILQGHSLWYVLLSEDSSSILKANSEIQKIDTVNDYQILWYQSGNTAIPYQKNYFEKPQPEFLPDGHWIYFSTEKDQLGISMEKYVKNHALDRYCKYYDLVTKLPNYYFEVKNGLLNGILYSSSDGKCIQVINRYKDGKLVERLYFGNNPDDVYLR